MPKNYYVILGIPTDSSLEDIKAAYRRLAKEYHPDHYGKHHSPFLLIHEAYTVLKDPDSRNHYDADLRKTAISTARSPHQPRMEHGLADIAEPLKAGSARDIRHPMAPARSIDSYSNLLDGFFDRMLSSFSEHRVKEAAHDTTIKVTLTPEQARSGGNLRMRIPVQLRCPNCRQQGIFGYSSCWRCSGSGMVTGDRQVVISYPPGVTSGHTVTLPINRIDGRDIRVQARFIVASLP